MKKVATIAGSDATGGGGLEADLKTFEEFGTFGLVAITSIVTLDPANGTHQLHALPLELIQEQIASVFAGPIDAIKTGLLPSKEIIALVSEVIPKDRPLLGHRRQRDAGFYKKRSSPSFKENITAACPHYYSELERSRHLIRNGRTNL